jgi:iron complex outermembrane receptor protein
MRSLPRKTSLYLALVFALAALPLHAETAAEADPAAEPAPEAQQDQDQTASSQLETITVTAQRREEPLQKVPIAVSAFSPVQFERAAITETLSLTRIVPNLTGHNNTGLGSANVYALRGLSNTETIATFDPPVGSYVDDVFIARQNANNFSLFDVERIEVLRGPQGTLFGRNTTGGAINVIMKKPRDEFGGYAEVGVGSFSERNFRGSVDVPFSESFLTKFSGYWHEDDGFVDNPITGEDDLNSDEGWGARAAFRWFVTEGFYWDLSADYVFSDHLNLLNFSTEESAPSGIDSFRARFQPGYVAPAVRAANFCRSGASEDRYTCTTLRTNRAAGAGFVSGDKADIPLGSETGTFSIISNMEWGTDFGVVNLITGYRRTDQEFAIDFFNGNFFVNDPPAVANPNPPPATLPAPSGTPFPGLALPVGPQGGFTIINDGLHKQYTAELKLTGSAWDDRLSYVMGVFALNENNETDFADLFGLSPTTTLVLEDRLLKNGTDSFAVYAQGDWAFADTWTFTAGGRWTDESKDIDYIANANPRLVRAACSATAPQSCRVDSQFIARFAPLDQDTRQFTPRFALRKDLSDSVNVFASATRGFKSGGWNARGTTPDQIQPFKPETIWSYELGLRSELLDRTLRVNLTAFYFEVEDFQLPSAFTQPSGAIQFITRNFAGLENKGAELELVWSPTEAFDLFANVGIQDAEYVDLDPSIVAQQQRCRNALAGNLAPPLSANQRVAAVANCALGIVNDRGEIADPVRAPDTVAIGASYQFAVGAGWTLTPSVVYSRIGKQTIGTNGNPIALVDAYTQISAGLSLSNPDSHWSAQLGCENCNDEIQRVSVLSNLPYYIDPRTWSFEVKYSF